MSAIDEAGSAKISAFCICNRDEPRRPKALRQDQLELFELRKRTGSLFCPQYDHNKIGGPTPPWPKFHLSLHWYTRYLSWPTPPGAKFNLSFHWYTRCLLKYGQGVTFLGFRFTTNGVFVHTLYAWLHKDGVSRWDDLKSYSLSTFGACSDPTRAILLQFFPWLADWLNSVPETHFFQILCGG